MEQDVGIRFSDDPMLKRRQKSAIRRKAINFTKIVSLIGIRHATDSKNSGLRRAIWIAWLLFGFGFALYQIEERTAIYFQYNTRTEFRIITDRQELLLPQVTVCNVKYVMGTAGNTEAKDINDRVKELDTITEAIKQEERQQRAENARDKRTEFMKKLMELDDETQNWETLSKNLSQPINKTIVKATFSGEIIGTDKAEQVKTDMGHCFAFSTVNNPLSSNKTGPVNGLFLELNTGGTDGFKMLIHDSYERPRLVNVEKVITLKARTVTRVAVSLDTRLTYLPLPYYNCSDEDGYRKTNCLRACESHTFISKCGCRDIHMTDDTLQQRTKDMIDSDKLPYCSYAKILDCSKYGFIGQKENSSLNENVTDLCECSAQCVEDSYKIAESEVREFKIDEGKVNVYVYYPQLTYMDVKNVASYTFLELLCEIGGALSLFLGATLLTVYEAMEFVILFIKDYSLFRFTK